MFSMQHAAKAQETRKQQRSKLGLFLWMEDGDGNRKWMGETSLEGQILVSTWCRAKKSLSFLQHLFSILTDLLHGAESFFSS